MTPLDHATAIKLGRFLGDKFIVGDSTICDSATSLPLNDNQIYAALMDAGAPYFIMMQPRRDMVSVTGADGHPTYVDTEIQWHCGMKYGESMQVAAFDTDKVQAIIKTAVQLPDVQ